MRLFSSTHRLSTAFGVCRLQLLTARYASTGAPRKPRVVVLGSGWGSVAFCHKIDKKAFDVVCVSPRNFFLMTPLLTSVAVGTIENRAIIENYRHLFGKQIEYLESECYNVDPIKHTITCSSSDPNSAFPLTPNQSSSRVVLDTARSRPETFQLTYDILVVSVGAQPNTFNVPGVKEYAHFLKELKDARRIRRAICDCFESAATPGQSDAERKRLLTFNIVGGGPTGVELAAEIHDFIEHDMRRFFPSESSLAQVCVINSQDHLLSSFDERICSYTEKAFSRHSIVVYENTSAIEVRSNALVIRRQGSEATETIPCAMTVWATGIRARPVVQRIRDAIGMSHQTNSKAILTDNRLIALGTSSIFAIGDCATIQQPRLLAKLGTLFQEADTEGNGSLTRNEFEAFVDSHSQKYPQLEMLTRFVDESFSADNRLSFEQFQKVMEQADSKLRALPATAQVAAQQGTYVANLLNANLSKITTGDEFPEYNPFSYQHLGSMAYIGGDEAVADFSKGGKILQLLNLSPLSGWGAFWLWRSIYFSKMYSTKNRLQLAMDWTRSKIFGRDISRD